MILYYYMIRYILSYYTILYYVFLVYMSNFKARKFFALFARYVILISNSTTAFDYKSIGFANLIGIIKTVSIL